MVNMVETKNEKLEKLKNKIKTTENKKVEEIKSLLATREKLERDYKEDIIKVTFSTSPETKRAILARRPTNEEMITLLSLISQATKLEGSADAEALEEMTKIYGKLGSIAAKLSIDESLDEEFWNTKISWATLNNFISELIVESQKSSGISQEEMKKFR